jgi:hypothetical protein
LKLRSAGAATFGGQGRRRDAHFLVSVVYLQRVPSARPVGIRDHVPP